MGLSDENRSAKQTWRSLRRSLSLNRWMARTVSSPDADADRPKLVCKNLNTSAVPHSSVLSAWPSMQNRAARSILKMDFLLNASGLVGICGSLFELFFKRGECRFLVVRCRRRHGGGDYLRAVNR